MLIRPYYFEQISRQATQSSYLFNAKLHFLRIFFRLSPVNPDLCHSDAMVVCHLLFRVAPVRFKTV